MKLSQRQYITRSGTHCPVCGKQAVASDMPTIGNHLSDLIRATKCIKCDATWEEVYILHRYQAVKDASGNPVAP
jgi:formate dehydrogenase maturation protein FdhE